MKNRVLPQLATCALGFALATACAATPLQSPVDPEPRETTSVHDEPAAVAEEGQTVDLPLRQLRTHHIVLPVVFGEHPPVDFILDTGASMSVITPATRDMLGFAADDGMKVGGRGAGGELTDVRVVVVPELRVGGRDYREHTVAVMDLSHLDAKLDAPISGILGRNFLEKHVVELDFVANILRLHDRDAVERGKVDVDGKGEVAYGAFEAGGLIRVDVRLDDADPFPAVLDLGAGRSVMNWKAAAALGIHRKSKGVKRSKEPLLGADNKPIETAFYRVARARLGDVEFSAPEVFLADLPVFETLGIAGGPAMIFGIDMFAGRTLVLDYPSRRIFVSRAPAGVAAVGF